MVTRRHRPSPRPAPRQRTIGAAEFKAHCLRLLDEVVRTEMPIVITKRGKPVAKVMPISEAALRARLKADILYVGDVLSPVFDDWDVDK